MIVELVPCYVIQSKSSGLFLTEDMSYSPMVSKAGRIYDMQQAVETAVSFFDAGDFEIFSFWDVPRAV